MKGKPGSNRALRVASPLAQTLWLHINNIYTFIFSLRQNMYSLFEHHLSLPKDPIATRESALSFSACSVVLFIRRPSPWLPFDDRRRSEIWRCNDYTARRTIHTRRRISIYYCPTFLGPVKASTCVIAIASDFNPDFLFSVLILILMRISVCFDAHTRQFIICLNIGRDRNRSFWIDYTHYPL